MRLPIINPPAAELCHFYFGNSNAGLSRSTSDNLKLSSCPNEKPLTTTQPCRYRPRGPDTAARTERANHRHSLNTQSPQVCDQSHLRRAVDVTPTGTAPLTKFALGKLPAGGMCTSITFPYATENSTVRGISTTPSPRSHTAVEHTLINIAIRILDAAEAVRLASSHWAVVDRRIRSLGIGLGLGLELGLGLGRCR